MVMFYTSYKHAFYHSKSVHRDSITIVSCYIICILVESCLHLNSILFKAFSVLGRLRRGSFPISFFLCAPTTVA